MSNGVVETLNKNQNRVRFLLDSGAFTAFKTGKKVELDKYCSFLEALPFKPWRYFTLDVIGDAKRSRLQYDQMLARGFSPVPIFTRGEKLEELDRYFESSDVVGLGGLGDVANNRSGYVKAVMRHVGKRRVHWLGFTSFDWIKQLRPYSCDASSWEAGARFAVAPLYAGRGRLIRLSKDECLSRKVSQEKIQAVLRLGFDERELFEAKNWNGGYSISRRVGAASMVAASLDVREKLGTELFLACATDYAANIVIDAFERVMSKREMVKQ